jgi:dUTP pyrophosphatase
MTSDQANLVGLDIQVRRIDDGVPLPAYQRDGDAGLDLHSAEDFVLKPGERAVIGTGIAVAIPSGLVGLTTPRSGLAARQGLSMVNAPGVIDSGYRGEIKLILINLDSRDPIEVKRGERVAQLVIVPVATVRVVEAVELPQTERGEGGLGSTGV